MRDIRFRAWDTDNCAMYYSGRDEDNGEGPIVWGIDFGGVFFEEMTLLDLEVGGEHEQQYRYMMPNQELMQYTGLHDTNGKEIYEGDVVQFTYWWFDGNIAESLLTGTIVYSDPCMSFQLKGVKNEEWERHTGYENDQEYLTPFSELTFEDDDFEVIGNIHENPELLEEP